MDVTVELREKLAKARQLYARAEEACLPTPQRAWLLAYIADEITAIESELDLILQGPPP